MKNYFFLTVITFLFLSTLSIAQEKDSTTIKLDEVIIGESRIQLPYAKQSRSIELIDKKTIQQSPVNSVAEVLHQIGGVDVRTRGAHGVQADIGIRGGTFDQTLILVNGIKINDPQTGHHSLNLPVGLDNIERIEVLKGPGARTYGQNAFSGAVNIVTASPKASFLRVGAGAGQNGLLGTKASGAIVSEKHSHYMAVNYDQADGYKHNTDYQIFNVFYNGTSKLGAGKLSFLGGYTDRSFGANGFYASPTYTEQYESVKTGLAALSYNTKLGRGRYSFEAKAYYRQNDDDYIFIRDQPEVYRNKHQSKTIGLDLNLVIPYNNATTGLGIDINKVSLESNNLGIRDRFVASLFAEHRMEFFNSKFNLTPGIQVNYYSDFDFKALPGIDAGYEISNKLTLFSSVGYTYRVPTFTDLYYEDPVNIGNGALLPEYAWNYELGLKTRGVSLVNAQTSIFYRDGSEMIDWRRIDDAAKWQPINLLTLKMYGVDTNMSFKLNDLFTSKNPFLQGLNINYTYIKGDAAAPATGLSRYALENLRHQFRAGLALAYGSRIKHSISAAYYDRANLDNYMLVDSRLLYEANSFNIFVDVTNIFDVTYQETNLVVMPGRWIKAGVNVTIF